MIPRHPRRRIPSQLRSMFLQFREVVEGIDTVQFAGVDEAHEQITYLGTIFGLIEQRVLSMQDRSLQRALDDVRVQRSARLTEEERQAIPCRVAISIKNSR